MHPSSSVGPPYTEVGGDPPRVWLELPDPGWDETTEPDGPSTVYRFDLTWLTSAWTCIFGKGCLGIDASAPDAGCCVHGAWFSEPADEERVAAAVARLDPDGWANHGHPDSGAGGSWAVTEGDARRTATVDGACVMHNPRGFPGGQGCALHALALRDGRPPMRTKPDVCWQLPLRRVYDDVERPDGSRFLQVTITEYTRRGWGAGGADFDWYCTASPAAHVGAVPVWVSLADELVELVGAPAYAALVRHCEQGAPATSVAGVTVPARNTPEGRRLLPLTVLSHPATVAAQAHLRVPPWSP